VGYFKEANSMSSVKSVKLETPQERMRQGGSSHARGKRPPAVKINGVKDKKILQRQSMFFSNLWLKKFQLIPKNARNF